MSVTTRRRRSRRLAAVALAAVAVLAATTACGDDSGDDAGANGGNITLTVDLFGEQGFGYQKLYEQYMKDNPKVKIVERGKGMGLGDYNTRLTQWIASNQGAGDVVALEEGTIVQFKAQKDNFVNLLDHGAAELQGNFLPWKWEQALTSDGTLLGLGTDVGSMAMCYRKDLFQAAGLPAERDQVSALWPTWEKFIEVGQTFAGKDKKAKFVDAATNVFNTVLAQNAGAGTGYTFFDKSDKLVLSENPDVKAAWDTTVAMINANLSAGLQSFSDQWTTGFKQAQFATIACPAWMTGVIQGNAGDGAAGKWDIAKAPGNGGNWGGSFLAVPKQSKNPAEAAKLAKFLTNPESQIEAFNTVGNLPSSTKALEDAGVLAKKNEYFSNAPTGQIFAAGAKDLKPIYLGSKNQTVRDAVENALRSIEQKQRTPDEAWQDALKNGEAAAK
jgi:cellobiose transport system substrate-binding protein